MSRKANKNFCNQVQKRKFDMGKTRKGHKGVGYDYWTRRPYGSHGYGPEVKNWTHRVERIQAKEQAQQGLKEHEDQEDEKPWACMICLKLEGECDCWEEE